MRSKKLLDLRILLLRRGLSQLSLARSVGISASRISRILCGRVSPRARDRRRIAGFLGISERSCFPALKEMRRLQYGEKPNRGCNDGIRNRKAAWPSVSVTPRDRERLKTPLAQRQLSQRSVRGLRLGVPRQTAFSFVFAYSLSAISFQNKTSHTGGVCGGSEAGKRVCPFSNRGWSRQEP